MINHTKGDYKFNLLEFGSKNKDAIMLLHGFPNGADTWVGVAEILAAKGYRVLVPVLRGYTNKYNPRKRRDYTTNKFLEDLLELYKLCGLQKAHIVGQDLGSLIASTFTHKYPEKVISLSLISVPHPRAYAKSLFLSSQIIKSLYIIFFQLPFIPEKYLSKNNGKKLISRLKWSGLSTKKANNYTNDLIKNNKLKTAINWYRALPLSLITLLRVNSIKTPSLLVYGDKEKFISSKSYELNQKYFKESCKTVKIQNSTHWLPEESPNKLAEAIYAFIKEK